MEETEQIVILSSQGETSSRERGENWMESCGITFSLYLPLRCKFFSGYAHWSTLLWHECCCQVFNIFHLKRRKNIFIDKFIPRSFTRNCIYSGNNPIGIHNGIDGLIKVLLLDFPALLILVLYSCTHSSLTRRKVGPSYFYPIYNFSVYHLCIISPGGVCVQSCNKCKHYLLG